MRKFPPGSILPLALLIAGPSLVACSSVAAGEPVTLNEAFFLQQGSSRVPAGSGCMGARLPAGPARVPPVGPGGDFSHSEETDGDAFLVKVFTDTELLATRRYDEATLKSGRVDEFSIVTHAGATYTLQFWGGPCAVGGDASSPD